VRDAADYIMKLLKAEQDLEEWQAAVEALLLVVNQRILPVRSANACVTLEGTAATYFVGFK
jgi:hypothetical protein